MNKEANMKTILEIAKECGASVSDVENMDFNICDIIIFDNESQLTATIDLWNRQNSEPVAVVKLDADNMKYIHWNAYHWTHALSVGSKLFNAPQQPQSVRDGLEMAAKVCDEYTNIEVDNDFNCGVRNAAVKILAEIRALIDQPEPPAS